jgi:hypothetical protein
MTLPLNDHTNVTSMEGSWDTWHGKTMLSPTVTSILEGAIVIIVLSVEKIYIILKKFTKCQHLVMKYMFLNSIGSFEDNFEFCYIQCENSISCICKIQEPM